MPTLIGRRAVLGALAAPFLAGSAEARPPFRLREDPQPLLSPPILDEAGTTRKLDDFAGRVILLNIWATWCPPCREEMPALEQLQGRLGGANFMVLPLCIDDAGIDRCRRFYDDIGIAGLPLFWAESLRVQLAFAFMGLPTTLLIDRDGREIGRLQGPFDWNGDAAVGQIVDVLRE
jgi:thiol-disulfide isomerase/thioredoxin